MRNLILFIILKKKISKANKGIGFIKKLNNTLPRKAQSTLCKPFVRLHLDYGDIIYDQTNNDSFCNKLETFQYNAALATTGSIQGTSKVKLYKELGLESLKSRRRFRHLCCFYKIKTFGLHPIFLIKSHRVFILTTLGTQRMLSHITTELTTSHNHSSLGPYLNGIS